MSHRASARLGGLCLLAALSAGCVMPDQVAQLQKDLADVRQELRTLAESRDRVDTRIADLERSAADPQERVTRADLADLRAASDAAAREALVTEERLADLERRVDRLAAEARSRETVPPAAAAPSTYPSIETAGVAAAAATAAGEPGATPDPESLYNTAYADFSRGNFALAVSGFEEYVERFPSSPNADNAIYWIGECHFSQGDFPAAVEAFDRLLERYPDSDRSAAANLKKGLAYMEQNDVQRAILQLRFVVSEYPRSDEAKVARDKLAFLGASP